METEKNCCKHENCKWEEDDYGYGATKMAWTCQDCGKVLSTKIFVD